MRYGATARVIYVQADPKTVHARWTAHRRAPQRGDVRDEDFANVVDHFLAPTPDEGTQVYNGSMPVHDWVARHIMRQG